MEIFNSPKLNRLFDFVPQAGDKVNWRALEESEFGLFLEQMTKIPQEYDYHQEGDVCTHTKMVVEALVSFDEFKLSSNKDKLILFLAGILHDIGKIRRTRVEDGRMVSPGHALKGAIMARGFLWKVVGLSGNLEEREIREAVCLLIRYHSYPPFAVKSHKRRLFEILSNSRLATEFDARKLYLLEKADVLGRISIDGDEYLEKVELFKLLAEENGCFEKPYVFSDDYTERQYYLGKTEWENDQLFDDTWGEVVLLSGLPGTGKDTFTLENYGHLPMVSLDNIRKRLGVLPTDSQGMVINVAQEEAKEYLRKKQPFVWNATNITSQIRQKQISLFERYNAKVKTIFLETEWQEGLRRNGERLDSVPIAEIEKMLSKLEIPERYECEKVEWTIV